MANNFDPLKKPADTTSKSFHSQSGKNNANTSGNDNRSSYNNFWKRQTSTEVNNPMYLSGEQQLQSASNKRFNFFNSLNRSLSRPETSDYSAQTAFPPIHNIEQGTKSNLESGKNSFEASNENPSESYPGEDYGPEETSAYYEEESYDQQKPYKKKGLSSKINRLVRRIPALGKVHKRPPTSSDTSESPQQYQYNQSSNSVDSNQFERELTADELGLNQRYTDKTRMKSINLQVKDQTQPVDLRIHRETNKIYACDIGRSVVEIYDMNGTLQHVVDGPSIIKFQPTAIAIAFDETIIIASHFNHCLHMYSPSDSQNASNHYAYKQFKLGSSGDQLHQFYHPAGIAIDHKDGFLYVCDRGNYRIQVIRPEGLCERVIELLLNGKKKHQLDAIRVAVQSNSDQLVCIVGNGDAICLFPKQTEGRIYVDPLYIVDENGLGLEGASGIAVDIHDRIFIADTVHHRIVICTPEGDYITSFGTEGDSLGQLKRPCGLDITSNGILVVTDPGNKRLQLFGLTEEQTAVENNPLQENSTELDLFDNL